MPFICISLQHLKFRLLEHLMTIKFSKLLYKYVLTRIPQQKTTYLLLNFLCDILLCLLKFQSSDIIHSRQKVKWSKSFNFTNGVRGFIRFRKKQNNFLIIILAKAFPSKALNILCCCSFLVWYRSVLQFFW